MKRSKSKIRQNKLALIEKYGRKCMLCGRTLAKENTTYHHIVPLYAGGTDDIENGAILGDTCCHRDLHRHDYQSNFYQLTVLLIKDKKEQG